MDWTGALLRAYWSSTVVTTPDAFGTKAVKPYARIGRGLAYHGQ